MPGKTDFDKQLALQADQAIKTAVACLTATVKYKDSIYQICAVLTAAEPAADIEVTSYKEDHIEITLTRTGATSFQSFERIPQALEFLGIPLEAWKTSESNAKYKYRKFTCEHTPFYISCWYWLGQNAKCEIVEIGREPQPDKIIYEMRCTGDGDAGAQLS